MRAAAEVAVAGAAGGEAGGGGELGEFGEGLGDGRGEVGAEVGGVVGLGDDLVDQAGRGQRGGRDALGAGELRGVVAVAVDDGGCAFGRQRGEPGVLGGDHPVGGQQGERAAAAALAEQDGEDGRAQADQGGQAVGDLQCHAVEFGLDGEFRADGVDHGEQRHAQLLGQFGLAAYGPQVGGGEGEFGQVGAGALLGDDHHRPSADQGQGPDECAVAVQGDEQLGSVVQQFARREPLGAAAAEYRIPGVLGGGGRGGRGRSG